MKKFLAAFLTLSCVLALASCGGGDDTSSAASTAATSSAASTAATSSAVSTVSIAPPVVSSEPEEEDTLNLAIKGTAIADGLHDEYALSVGVTLEALNDGNHSTRWQASNKGEGVLESEENASWFGIQWEEAQTFDTIITDWENAHPLEDGFRIEISEDGENWEKVEFESERTGTMNEAAGVLESDHQKDTITLDEAVTTKYVRVYCFTYYTVPEGLENAGNTKSPTSCWEIEIYNSADVEAAEGAEDTESAEE